MTNSSGNHTWNDAGHTIARIICQGIYFMMGSVYDILTEIAKSEIISSDSVLRFYKRVQLIIGIFMMFRLIITIMQGIMDPDKFTDSKTGVGSLVMKVITALVILTLIIPIENIPATVKLNSYEKNIKSNGILFGTLYEFQTRVLREQVLAKLVLGTNKSSDSLKSTGANLATIVLRSFFTPNLKPGSDSKDFLDKNGKYKHEYLYCNVYEGQKDDDGDEITDFDYADEVKLAYKVYYHPNASAGDILNMINQGCESEYDSLPGYDSYAFNFNWFAGLIVGLIFLVVLVLLCVEVAKRAIKLALLRLIAPIPIISYMNPKTDFENGPMGAWIKTLTTTYLELFMNLLVIYFAIFIIQEIDTKGGLQFPGSTGLFAKIFVYIGLILFAKDAPKFMKQAIGIKEDSGGFLSGLGGVLAGVGAGALGAVGSYKASKKANYLADEANGKDHNLLNRTKNVGAGLLGGITGFGTGVKAGATSKDHAFKNSFDAMQKRNSMAIAAGDVGSTSIGRARSTMDRLFAGETTASKMNREIENMEGRKSALEAVKSRMSGEMVKQKWTYGNLGIDRDNAGNSIGKVNYKSFMAAKNAAESAGQDEVTFKDHEGNSHTISMEQANMQEGFLLKNNEDDYIQKAVKAEFVAEDGTRYTDKQDKVLVDYVADATAKGASVSNRESITAGIDTLDTSIRQKKTANAKNVQNDRFSEKK